VQLAVEGPRLAGGHPDQSSVDAGQQLLAAHLVGHALGLGALDRARRRPSPGGRGETKSSGATARLDRGEGREPVLQPADLLVHLLVGTSASSTTTGSASYAGSSISGRTSTVRAEHQRLAVTERLDVDLGRPTTLSSVASSALP
jgi:hypothetical protein